MPLVEQELLSFPEHLSLPPVFSGVHVTRSLVLYVCFVDRCLSFCTFSFGHCVGCSSIYDFWLPLWYLQTLLVFFLRRRVLCYKAKLCSVCRSLFLFPVLYNNHVLSVVRCESFEQWRPVLLKDVLKTHLTLKIGRNECPLSEDFWRRFWRYQRGNQKL